MLTTWNIMWNVINLIVLFGLLYWLTAKPLGNMIRNKQKKTASSISDVEARLNEVNKKLNSQVSQLEEIKTEMKKIEEKAEHMSIKLREDIIKSAQIEAEKVREQIKKSMEQDINRSKADLKKEIVDKALIRAQEIVKQGLDRETQMKLIESFAMTLDNKSSNN